MATAKKEKTKSRTKYKVKEAMSPDIIESPSAESVAEEVEQDTKLQKKAAATSEDSSGAVAIADVVEQEATAVEPEMEIPEEVEELLQDISTAAPTGVDVEHSDDKSAVVAYMNLESEMDKRSGNDYEKCIEWAKTILTEHSKHLRIAVWLCISWLRTEGISGFVNGLLLITQLFTKYGEKLFPAEKEHQSRALRLLNNDPRFAVLKKVKFGDEEPVFSITTEKLSGPRANDLPGDVLLKMKKLKGQSFVGEGKFFEAIRELKKEKIDQNRESLIQLFRDEDPDNRRIKYGLSDRSFKIMRSIEGFDEHRQRLLDLMNEVYTSEDQYIDAVRLAIDNQATVLYRPLLLCLANQNLMAYLDIKPCLAQLLVVMDDYLGEEAPSLGHLTEITEGNLARAQAILDKEIEQARKGLRAHQPQETKEDNGVAEAMEQRGADPRVTKDEELPEPEPQTGPDKENEVERAPETILRKTSTRSDDGQSLAVQKLTINWETDAEIAIKKALRFHFLAENAQGEKTAKVASDPRVYGISRILRWGNVQVLPADKTAAGPNDIKQQYLEQAFTRGEYDTVISDCETNFVGNDEFLFWLDAQRYVVQSLEQKGAKWRDAAQEVRLHLARLITRLSRLPTLTFSDEKTPFANKETLKWLEAEVKGHFGEGRIKEKILPPIMGEDYEPLKREYEAACEELPENFERNAKALQEAIASDVRKKGQFLRRLNLANYCYLAKEYSLARGFFDELVSQIEGYNISEWERALCVSVWQSVFLNNQKLLEMELATDDKSDIENKNKELLKRIGRYDVVLALKLTDNHMKREDNR